MKISIFYIGLLLLFFVSVPPTMSYHERMSKLKDGFDGERAVQKINECHADK